MMNRIKCWIHRHEMLKDQVKVQDYAIGQMREEFAQFKFDIFNKFDVHQQANHEHLISMQKAIDTYMTDVVCKSEFDQLKQLIPSMKRSITTLKTAVDKIRKDK